MASADLNAITDTLVEVRFRPDSDGTRVELIHTGWEVFGADADERRAGYADADGWATVLARLVRAAGE